MASGTKMSFNIHQSSKLGGLTQISQKDIEVSQDMHLKMSKKIAQLTKVIYALNTKNDEHEQVLQNLKDQHEEELQKVLADTQKKLLSYKTRMDEEVGHRGNVEALYTQIEEYKQKNASMEEKFSIFKAKAQEVQEKEKEIYANKLSDLSHQVVLAKKDFEDHLQMFSSWKERILTEQAVVLAELKSKHQKELEDIRSFQRNQDDIWLNQCSQIEEKFKSELENLHAQVEDIKNEKIKLEEDYVAKLEKAQAFYKKELEALKNNQSDGHSKDLETLKKEIDRLKGDFNSNEKELKTQIDRLVHQLAETEDNLEESKKQMEILQAELVSKDLSSRELFKNVQDIKKDLAEKVSVLQSTETELSASKEHCSNLADELLKKSTTLGELEAHNIQKEGKITSLQDKLDKLKERITRLDAERSSLHSHAQSLSLEQNIQLKNLRQALEDMTVEKETLKQWSDRQIQSLKDELVQQEKNLSSEFKLQIDNLLRKHNSSIELQNKKATEELTHMKNKLIEQHQAEMSQMKNEKDNLQKQLERLKNDLGSELSTAQKEVARLEKLVKDSQEGLGSASDQLESLKNDVAQLRSELEKTKSELRFSKSSSANLQEELDKLRSLHDNKMAEMEAELQTKLKSQSEELDSKWSETMRLECYNLRLELIAQKEDEKKAALSQLAHLKNEEMTSLNAGLEVKLTQLNKQLVDLQTKLDSTKSMNDSERSKWKLELELEKERAAKEMLEAANDFSRKLADMREAHEKEITKLKLLLVEEKNDLEIELKKRHMDEIQGQLAAHKAAISHQSQLARQEMEDSLAKLRAHHLEELAQSRNDIEQQKLIEINKLKDIHQNELTAARMELDRAIEISKQKERDHHSQNEELKTEIGYREQHIKNLQEQLNKVQEQTTKFKQEIDSKLSEIKQIQKQAAQQLRLQEDKLKRQNQSTVENLTADHLRDQQEMLAQFNTVQDMLKDKISALQIELEEAKLRYAQRESRPEDLELIESLRCELSEREIRIKDLIEEKRFYQLELVNRETNFNKIFNTSPNVGLLNPLQKPKKKVEKAFGSNVTQRLEPLPGSPLHDGRLNPAKPLPPPNFNKKFLR